jgi:16S rRNA G1207 methylase RsmC
MSHYYSENQTSELKLNKIEVRLLDHPIELYSGSGVFSIKKVDKGTELLINKAIIKDKWEILDIGCGYGVVGIAIAKAHPSTKITMTDINKRAIKLTKMNIKLNSIENTTVFDSNLYAKLKDKKFNTILTNPPQNAGKEVCFSIIEKAKSHLKKGGLLQLVARHNKGGKSLNNKMEEVFGNVKDIGKASGYRVYVSEN